MFRHADYRRKSRDRTDVQSSMNPSIALSNRTNLDWDEEQDDPDKDGDLLHLRLLVLHDLVLDPDLDEAEDELDLLRLRNPFLPLDLKFLGDLAGDGDFDADCL